jgi:predicted RNase H-like HicB family nuclease
MIDATRPHGVLSDDVLDALRRRGFAVDIVDEHAVATRDATRLVVPAPGRHLPATFAQRLEHALGPLLGRDWLHPDPSPSPTTIAGSFPEVVLLDAVVDPCPVSGQWCAFLPSELTVMGLGPTRDLALRDLKKASALWIGINVGNVVLITPDVI